eukprot:4538329-Prymnesium_polylepis.1
MTCAFLTRRRAADMAADYRTCAPHTDVASDKTSLCALCAGTSAETAVPCVWCVGPIPRVAVGPSALWGVCAWLGRWARGVASGVS